MRIDVVTLFPEMIEHAVRFGVTARARERKLWQLGLWNPRDFARDNHRTVDDRPYGGGPGMVMLPGPLCEAIDAARAAQRAEGITATRTIHLTPAGTPLTHARVAALSEPRDAGYVLIAGRYEGIDERVANREVDEEIAVGDIVVSGGELPALMLIDAIVRRVERRGICGAGIVRRRFARLSALHPARDFRGHAGSRGAAVGQSCGNRPLAQHAGAWSNM